jgi:tRNA 2-selenouridine synthase
VLSQVGWRTAVLAGGYRTYRRHVKARLYDEAPALKLVLIDGRTGSGKTEMLGRLAARGLQVLDLEGLAEHRGSLLGALPGRPQPSQKLFESRLLEALDGLDPAQPIVAEAEASKVGERMIPPALWQAMAAAPKIVLAAPPNDRAAYLARRYADACGDFDALEALFNRLPSNPGRKRIAAWRALAEAGDLPTLAGELMELHYDPAYDRILRRDEHRLLGEVAMPGLDDAAQEAAADEIAAMVGRPARQTG